MAGGGGDTPVLFYSRRIGLNQGREAPIVAGGRLTGRVGKFSLGILNIQTDDAPAAEATATNFSVVRLRRDLLRRSSNGLLFTGRSVSPEGTGSNEAYGIDGLFSFYDNLNINTYWAKTSTSRRPGDDVSYRAQLDYRGDRYGVQLDRLAVGDNFNPEVGFLRRDDFERSFGSFRFSPRPQFIAAVRKFSWEGRIDYITDRAGVLETREVGGQFGIEFESSDRFDVGYTRSYELLEQPFRISSDVTIPVGGYRFQDVDVTLALGQQRPFAGGLSFQRGSFFSGTKTSVSFGGRRTIRPRPCGTDAAPIPRAESRVRLGRPAGRRIHHAVSQDSDDLHGDAADVRERPVAIQLQQRLREHQHQAPVGIPIWQRAVRCV